MPSKRSFPNRSTTHSKVHLDHQIHRKSKLRPTTAPQHVYRVWDSTQPVSYKYHKRQFIKTQSSANLNTAPLRTGKRMIDRPKREYPAVPRYSTIRMFPEKKEQTFDKPWAYIPARHKKILSKPTKIQTYLSPRKQPKIPNLSKFPRQNISDVWKAHTPMNVQRPQTSHTSHRSLIGTILMHSC